MPDSPGALFLAHRTEIESVIRLVCRRSGLHGDAAEDFASEARLRLIENDYDKLRAFQGRSTFRTYLTTVIGRVALDYQAACWGRWRPSMVGRNAGPAAVRLEQLVVRDAVPLQQALTIVDREMGNIDRAALEALAARFPLRVRRRYIGEEVLEAVAAESADAERLLVRADEAERFERVKSRLADLLAGIDPSERLVLQLKFEQGLKVADIARLQHLDQKRLYRRINDALARLRRVLEAEGLDADAVRGMLSGVEPEAGGWKPAQTVRLCERNAR